VGLSPREALSLLGEKTHGIPRGGEPCVSRGDGASGSGSDHNGAASGVAGVALCSYCPTLNQHFARIRAELERLGTAGNLTTDAHLAVLAMERGYVLYSIDRDQTGPNGVRISSHLRLKASSSQPDDKLCSGAPPASICLGSERWSGQSEAAGEPVAELGRLGKNARREHRG